MCYFYQITLALVPDFLRSEALGSALGAALNLLHSKIDPFVDPKCAKIANRGVRQKMAKNIQQPVFAGGHPPNY